MSTSYLFKRVVSILLIFCIITPMLTVNANSNTNLMTFDSKILEKSITQSEIKEYEFNEKTPILELNNSDLDKALSMEGNNFTSNSIDSSLKSKYEDRIAKNTNLSNDTSNINEYEASFNSLISQLSTTGISVWSVMGEEGAISPSSIDHRTRVSYEINTPIYANYESSNTAVVKFKLNNPSEQVISFDYNIYSGSARYSGSASYLRHFDTSRNGTITFEVGETEKILEIDIKKLINNPTEYRLPSEPSEFWTGDRVLYINCNNINNALFDNDKENISIPVKIENQFDFIQTYQNAIDDYLVDLSNLSNVTTFPETPGKYLNKDNELKIGEESIISTDVRKMIDTGVFSHINMPIGYFLNENNATGDVLFKIEKNIKIGPEIISDLVFDKPISVNDNNQIDFNISDLEISAIGLGPDLEGNGIIDSLITSFDYSNVTGEVYTYFTDNNDNYIQNQMNFIDKINPYVKSVSVPNDTFYFGENIPITITYNEPVLIDGISIKANGMKLYPIERKGTISNTISFLYEIKENYKEVEGGHSNKIIVTDIIGAVDLSGKIQQEASTYTLEDAKLDEFNEEKSFSYCANTDVSIIQGKSINAKGKVTISLKKNTELMNWLSGFTTDEYEASPIVKARVIGKEGTPIDVDLNVVMTGDEITGFTGEFNAPANLSDRNNYYVAEIYFRESDSEEFRLLYSLSKEYVIPPIVYIDDENDLEILYTNWPSSNKIIQSSETHISLGYKVDNNATWQEDDDFSWSSSNTSIAKITQDGDVNLTGGVGSVTFSLTALNGGLDDNKKFSIDSKTLEIVKSEEVFLHVPYSSKNIEITKGNNANVYYSTNITKINDSFGGSGTITTYSYDLYEAEYKDSELIKGKLVHRQTLEATDNNDITSYTIDSQYLVNTSVRGKYSYILEISARDLQSNQELTTSTNICVKELPAKAILSKPLNNYITDDNKNINVRFNIDNKNVNTEFYLTVMKNEETVPVFSTNDILDIDKELTVDLSPVDSNRLRDVYTIVLKAKNEFDEAFSYDSYFLYVYNSNSLKIMVNGEATDHLTMSMNDELSTMTSAEILALNRKINLTDEISINNKQYKWSNIADKITWEVGDDNKISLKYNDNGIYKNIDDYSVTTFLPNSNFLLRAILSGDTSVTASHYNTGMQTKLNITVDEIKDKLYIFQVYPAQKSTVYYTNGKGEYKTIETDNKGRLAIYEESGIRGDVEFEPKYSGTYDYGIIKYNNLIANQNSINDFGLYPQNNVKLPVANYKTTILLYDDETKEYSGDVLIKGGVYRNGVYCPDAKINGKSGKVDQIVSSDWAGKYVLNFNPLEFTTKYNYDRLTSDDKIEYIIEVSFPDNSHQTRIIKIDDKKIKEYRNHSYGVLLFEDIQKLNSTKVQNNVNIISQTLTIDGKEKQMDELLIFEDMPESAIINTELILSSEYNKNYKIEFVDDYDRKWGLFSNIVNKETYEFSNTIILRNTFEISKLLFYMEPGEKFNLHMKLRISDGNGIKEINLSKPIKLINFVGIESIPKIDTILTGDIKDFKNDLMKSIKAPYNFEFNEDNDNVKSGLAFLKDYSIIGSSTRLEIKPTDDPLVYKGIIKFAVGDLTIENPEGIFMGDDSSSEFSFTPVSSDVNSMSEGDYIKKLKKKMNDSKDGSKGYNKTFSGGAYAECEIFYDVDQKKWRLIILKSDVYMGAGGEYYVTYNTWVGPIPVTAQFKTGLKAQVSVKTKLSNYDLERDYITELHPQFYIYGFGGFGADYDVVALKVGPYGQIDLDTRFLWHNNKGENGQKITISGTAGIELTANVVLFSYTEKYEIGKISKAWKFNDYDKISSIYDSESDKMKSIYNLKSDEMILSSFSDDYNYMILKPVSETVEYEDRSYLNTFDRKWYGPVRTLTDEEISIIQTNAYPNSNPVITDDGIIMAYTSDMDSTDVNDTAVNFTKKNEDGYFTVGKEIDASDYPDTDVVIDGTSDTAVLAWTRVISDLDKSSGEEALSEDIRDMMSGTEIMTSIYNGTDFTTTRLTNNSTPDMSPVVATNGNKAVVAWRSLYASDMENPFDFDGRDNIMYSIFDGSKWSEVRCLYDGSIDKVKALNINMLSDGTSAITYQVKMKGTENTEIFYAILDENGNILNNIRLTNNEVKDENPKITSVVFPDEVERFIIGWNTTEKLSDDYEEKIIRLSAIDQSGKPYPQFEEEVENSHGVSNYNDFKFTEGAKNLENLSIVWTESKQEEESDSDSIYKDVIWGRKFLQDDDGNIIKSPKIKLLELDDQNVVDFFSSYVDSNTKEINFAMLVSDYSSIESQSKLATGKSSYKNNLVLKETYFSNDDLLPGIDMPILFSLYNEGVEPIRNVTINIADASYTFEDDIIEPGQYKDFTVFYTVPNTIINPDFNVTAQFLTSTDTKSGILNMDIPDVGIYDIDILKEIERERMFSVQLQNTTFSKLKEGKHVVKLEVYDTPDFSNTPIITRTISDAESLEMINDGLFTQNITLSEEDLKRVLDENGEIPKEGARIFFNAVLEENSIVIDDADISNNSDYVKIHSLLTKNSKPISFESLMQVDSDKTIVQIEALNNSMNEITNGNIIVNIRDDNGNIIETQQTFNTLDIKGSLINIGGEETFTKTFNFSKVADSYDVAFSNIVDDSLLLSELKFRGVPLDFDKNVYNYDLEVIDLSETFITIAAENPNSDITIYKNGELISSLEPCSLVYGINTFEVVVKTNLQEVTYTVKIQNVEDDINTYTLSVTAPTFGTVTYGYAQPLEKNITITSSGNADSTISSVELSGDNADAFVIIDGDTTVTAGNVNTSYKVKPITNLNVGTYKATITVTYNGGQTATANVIFKVNKVTSHINEKDTSEESKKEPKKEYNNQFNDVSESEWFYEAVKFAYENNLMVGTSKNTFSPKVKTTRGMLITVLYRIENEPEVNTSNFKDVNDDKYYAKPVAWGRENGIVNGISKTEFAPNIGLAREQLVTILYRYAEFKGYDISKKGDISNYKDRDMISNYALPAMKWAVEIGLIKGRSDTEVVPKEDTIRAEMAEILKRFIELFIK